MAPLVDRDTLLGVRTLAAITLLAACGTRAPAPSATPTDLDVTAQPHARAPLAAGPPPGDAAVVAAEVTSPPPARAEAPLPPPEPTLELMKWKADTASFVLRSSQHVYAEADATSTPLGKIIAGTRLPIAGSVAGDRRCKAWLAVRPAGWICGHNVTASPKAPLAEALPVLPPGQLLPQQYYGVRKGAARFKSVEAVQANTPFPEPKSKSSYMVTKGDVVDVDGVDYIQTGVGFVAATDLYKLSASTFSGIDLVGTPPPAWPFAWVTGEGAKALTVRAAPAKQAAVAGRVTLRQVVPVLEERDGFVRIAPDQWLARASVRIARQRPRPVVPDGDTADARWIDIDRDEQVMIAYDGTTPVFATLVSSGVRKTYTPPAVYRIRSKAAVTKMAAEERESSHYEVSEVPWATRFRSGLYFHAAYWHDDFGTARSHGCVNMSPRDAKWVYDWTTPAIPAGWNELEVPMAGAMIVRVFDAKQPDPPLFDYEQEAKERVKIRKREKRLKAAREAAEATAADVMAPLP